MGEIEELDEALGRLRLLGLLIARGSLVDELQNFDLIVLLFHVSGPYCKCYFGVITILERNRIDHALKLVLVDALFSLLIRQLRLGLPCHREVLLLCRLHLLPL